jgi:diacylglycerol kinase family enzyme
MGGDGTLNEVANGLLGRDLPLIFLPSGTGNAMAYEMGIPRNPVRAAQVMIHSDPVSIYPGMVGGRAFMLMAGFGFDAHAVFLVTKKLKKFFGPAAYFLTAATVLIKAKPIVTVHTPDGRELRGTWAVGLRSRHYAGPFEMHPRANLKRAELGVAVVPTAMILPYAVTNLIFRTGWTYGGIRLEEHRGFRVVTQQSMHVHVDGDYIFEGAEFEVTVSERAVSFCFPRAR